MKNLNDTISVQYIEKHKQKAIDLAQKLWAEPEIAWNEVKAARWSAELLREEGFAVEEQYRGIPTAVRGVWGSGHPVIGLLGEMDALPALSQKISSVQEAVTEGAPGHGCGHNLMAAASIAAAMGIKEELQKRGLEGTIVYYGCPAEEVVIGKAVMAREGAFRELDVAMSWHGDTLNRITYGTANGLNNAVYHFKGRSSHAGGSPQNGRSALDAVELMNVGANYLREHVTDDVRIHYVITNGGAAPNIVPEYASVWYYVRAQKRATVEDAYARLCKVAQGAAMMTETEVSVEFRGGCYNTMENHALSDIIAEVLENIGVPCWTQEELEFARQINEISPIYQTKLQAGALENGPLSPVVGPHQHENSFGSTDVGDVQHIVPCSQINTAMSAIAGPWHGWSVTACSGHSIGMKGMLYGAKVMAATAILLVEQPELMVKIKEEFERAVKAEPYVCPIPPEFVIPQPVGEIS